ncbi:MAG TPA: FHA domain-containing protein [Trebonia sp.]|nr:FHA domain-containing protein [Trebonia sp.]
MTDMAITACVPLPGEGLVARRGDLVVVTDGQADGPDPLIGALDEVTGDGGALILAAARAMLTHPGQFSGACAGVTASGEVAVLVHGNAGVTVVSDDGPDEQLDARGSMLPVNRTFSGSVVRVWLRSGGPVTSDDRLRLDGGVVYGGGVALTVASVAELASGAVAGPARTDMLAPGSEVADDLAPRDDQAGNLAMPGPVYPDTGAAGGPEDRLPVGTSSGPWADDDVQPGPGGPETPFSGDAGRADTLPPFATPAPVPEPTEISGSAEFWFTAGQEAISGPGDEWRPPTFVVPATGPAAPGREPPLHNPQGADFEFELFLQPDGTPADDGPGLHDHDHDHGPAEQELGLDGPPGQDLYVADPALVDGVLCARNHFNDPDVQYCRQCGIAMVQLTQRIQKGPRPPLGVLLLDDGTGFTLDKDYVVGREPVLDGDVAAGRARPLRIPDPGGTVSRLHLRISLIGWQVEVRDINSSNGSVVHFPDGHEQRLLAGDSTLIPPGTKIAVGHRSLQYQSYRAG